MNYKEVFEKIYKGKKVFLTGHTGFKGSWMLAWLHRLGAIVKGYALAPENENDIYNLISGDKLCESVIADIRDMEKLRRAVIDFRPDFIFHLAAQPLVRRSYEMPLYTFEVNVNGTANLLDVVRELANPCYVVVVTTDKVYENKEANYAYEESDKLGGYDPYSASKAAAEIVVRSYRDSFFNILQYDNHKKAIATARAGNVIGGGDWATDRIIPDMIRAFRSEQPIVIRNPQSVRPWQHVTEPLSGYLLLGASMMRDPVKFSSAWNFGPESNVILTVKEIAEQAIKAWGSGSYTINQPGGQLHEAGLLMLNINKAKNEINWIPKLAAEKTIEWTMQWYRNADHEAALGITLDQIGQYQEL